MLLWIFQPWQQPASLLTLRCTYQHCKSVRNSKTFLELMTCSRLYSSRNWEYLSENVEKKKENKRLNVSFCYLWYDKKIIMHRNERWHFLYNKLNQTYGLLVECLWFFQAILAKCSGFVPREDTTLHCRSPSSCLDQSKSLILHTEGFTEILPYFSMCSLPALPNIWGAAGAAATP